MIFVVSTIKKSCERVSLLWNHDNPYIAFSPTNRPRTFWCTTTIKTGISDLPQTGGHSLISKFNDTVLPVFDKHVQNNNDNNNNNKDVQTMAINSKLVNKVLKTRTKESKKLFRFWKRDHRVVFDNIKFWKTIGLFSRRRLFTENLLFWIIATWLLVKARN